MCDDTRWFYFATENNSILTLDHWVTTVARHSQLLCVSGRLSGSFSSLVRSQSGPNIIISLKNDDIIVIITDRENVSGTETEYKIQIHEKTNELLKKWKKARETT